MTRWIIYIIIGLIPLQGLSQHKVRGVVVDKSEDPVVFATVYINETTIGTTTNLNGEFELTAPYLPANIIISYIGFATKSVIIDSLNKDNIVTIILAPTRISIPEVKITGNNRRHINLVIFEECFLGTDRWGRNAEILNDSALIFEVLYEKQKISEKIRYKLRELDYIDEQKNDSIVINRFQELVVHAPEPLQINSPLLGYHLQYDLVEFTMQYSREIDDLVFSYVGYSYYIPKEYENIEQIKLIEKNRKNVYFNSSLHFLKALFDGEIAEQGYQIFKNKGFAGTPLFKTQARNLNDFLIYKNDYEVIIKGLKNRIFYIQYYHDDNGNPLNLTKEYKRYPDKYATIMFFSDECLVRKNGTTPAANILFTGDIGKKHVGATLPFDYKPALKETGK